MWSGGVYGDRGLQLSCMQSRGGALSRLVTGHALTTFSVSRMGELRQGFVRPVPVAYTDNEIDTLAVTRRVRINHRRVRQERYSSVFFDAGVQVWVRVRVTLHFDMCALHDSFLSFLMQEATSHSTSSCCSRCSFRFELASAPG